MSDRPETVQPSDEPTAGAGTGTGAKQQSASPTSDQAASTSGLGTVDEQRGSAPPAESPYSLNPDHRDEAQSDSGT